MEALVRQANQRLGGERNAFEFLTGRPMNASERYGDWFAEQLKTQSGELSQGQLFTLFLWAHSEWRRAQGQSFPLPVNGSSAQFVSYQEVGWRME